MNSKPLFTLMVGLGLLCRLIAQEDEISYVARLTGEIDMNWLQETSQLSPVQTISWKHRNAPGLKREDPEQRKQTKLDEAWLFSPAALSSTSRKGYPTSVKLPHEFPRNRNYKAAWYLTQFQLDTPKSKRLFLLLNRVDLLGVVYLNGQRIGHHLGSYTPFEFDITDALKPGANTLALFVYDRSAAVDGDKAYNQLGPAWLKSSYSQGKATHVLPGGIDDVPILELREPYQIQDIFVTTSTRKGEMQIEYELQNLSNEKTPARLSFEVLQWPNGQSVDLPIPDEILTTNPSRKGSLRVAWSRPKLWSPDHPNLYVLRTTLTTKTGTDILDTRFGFREFWIEGKNFMLNGVPIRLRGESTYRDFRLANESHTEIFKRYKEIFGSNACRIHAYMPHGDIILGADEAGVLLINQSAIWSVNVLFYKNGGERFLSNVRQEFEEWARRDRNSPSVVIWDVENEMLRYDYEQHLPWVSQLPGFIERYDQSRPFNFSGGGWFDPDQDMASLHMQEHYTRIMGDWKKRGSSPLLMGEFWVGGRMEQRIPTSPEFPSVLERFIEEGEIYRNRILEMREYGVSGVMPFRLSLLAFDRSNKNSEGMTPMRAAAAYAPIKHALQAETVFAWPRQMYASAHAPLQRELVVCNDGETEQEYTIRYGWKGQAKQRSKLHLKPGEQGRIPLRLPPPLHQQTLVSSLSSNGEVISSDTLTIAPLAQSDFTIERGVHVYDDENLAKKLRAMGLTSNSSDTIPAPASAGDIIWIIPPGANNRELGTHKDQILSFLDNGGTILCLKQNQAPSWFPTKLQFWSAIQTSPHTYAEMGWEGLHKDLFYSRDAPILMKDHPIFSGIENQTLHYWNPIDGRVSDDVFARPSSVDKYESGNWRPLASGTRREHVSIAEFFHGKGTLLSSQLNLLENLENPQANRLLGNILGYLSEKSPGRFDRKIALRGKVSPNEFSKQLGVPIQSLQDGAPAQRDLMIAFRGSDPKELADWAAAGGTVFIASDSISSQLTGASFERAPNERFLGSKIAAHDLLGGVSSALFITDARLRVSGHFSHLPDQAQVLLQGFHGKTFWNFQEAGPILFRFPYGKGEILASSLSCDSQLTIPELELFSLILTNNRTLVENAKSGSDRIIIKKTVPIAIDGELNEWLEDMEDRFVTPYLHAQPIYLTSENIVEGPPEFDLNLSAINYLLWNEEALHIAGVVFGEKRTFETGIDYGRPKSFKQEIKYGSDTVTLFVKDDVATATVNGTPVKETLLATSKVDSQNLTDATQLQFSYIVASGKIASVENLIGNTFELKIPWELLRSTPSQNHNAASLTLTARGSKIQVPANASSANSDTWMPTRLVEGK